MRQQTQTFNIWLGFNARFFFPHTQTGSLINFN